MSKGGSITRAWQCSRTLLLLASVLYSNAIPAQGIPRPPAPMPVGLRMVVPEARLPVRLQKVDVRAEVLGSTAHTRIEMVFFNPNERQLEGELQFPLLDGQTVVGFALDINGELRSAVPVDKPKGQQVFEDVTRVRVDPALLEKTQGNNYKLRIYPLPAKGTRRVVLELDESLSRDRSGNTNKNLYYINYRLPLQFSDSIDQLDVAVHNAASPERYSAIAVRARLGAERVPVSYAYEKEAESGSLVSFSRKNYVGKAVLSIDFPGTQTSLSSTETRGDQRYFYTEVTPPPDKRGSRILPKKLGVVWDASGSGVLRDHGREFAVLDAYLKVLGNVIVELVVARDKAQVPQTFAIKNGQWGPLRYVLEGLAYDGATSGAALSPSKTADLNLLFSDGLINYGESGLIAADHPLYAVNSAVSADRTRLRAISENAGGRLLDLLTISPADAVNELTHRQMRLVGIHSNGAKDLISGSVYPEGDRMRIAGILAEPQATIDLEWINANGQSQIQHVTVAEAGGPATPFAASRWASFKLAQMESDYSAHRTAIRQLGMRFGIPTRETSLIVLDRVDDYVRYEITPPESLRTEYQSQLARKTRQMDGDRHVHLEDIVQRFAEKVKWWGRTFPKDDKPAPPASHKHSQRDEQRILESVRLMSMASAVAPESIYPPPPSDGSSKKGVGPAVAPRPSEASIQLKRWQPDASYARRLREASVEGMYQVYLDERIANANSTAFFLDAADIFFERGQPELGSRILSNLAEMDLENRQILRILAYRLLQAKQPRLALPILQQVLTLSPNEPQSWRDLGLAYADNKQYQMAVDSLWEVVARPWNNRFPDIELIALAELNGIVARAPTGTMIDTVRIDSRLLRNLPLDLRAVLSWDADNTDIDLWVTDPNKEKVFYENRLGYQGGAMSRDFTSGYGPEEFSLRDAKPGKYKVQAHFFGNHQQIVSGATTLMLRLTTGFGTPRQKDETITLRLSGQGKVVDVGEFTIGASQAK